MRLPLGRSGGGFSGRTRLGEVKRDFSTGQRGVLLLGISLRKESQHSFIHGPQPLEPPAIIAAVSSTVPTHNKTAILSPTKRAHVNIPLVTCHGSPLGLLP